MATMSILVRKFANDLYLNLYHFHLQAKATYAEYYGLSPAQCFGDSLTIMLK